MKLIKSFLGRRQFLIAAGAVSASALAFKRLVGVVGQGFQTNGATVSDSFTSIAMAGEKAGTADIQTITSKYPHLFSPLKIRNRILKNRILYTPAPPHFLQGPENFPSDAYRNHYSEIAKNAAIVSITEHFGTYPKTYEVDQWGSVDHSSDRMWEDIPPVHNYIQRLFEDIHCEGALVAGANIGGGIMPGGTGPQAQPSVSIEDIVTQARKIEDYGYDVVSMGGVIDVSDKDSVRRQIEQMQAVRNATNLLIELHIRPYSPGLSMGVPAPYPGSTGPTAGGPVLEELVAIAKVFEGSADYIRMKDGGHATSHPNSFTMEKDKPWMLRFAQAIKDSGNKMIVCPSGGFHYPELNDEWIRSGKMDMVGMATPFFADPEWVQKAYDGRAEDIVPCLMCHGCHGFPGYGPWYDACTVNPKWALPAYKKSSIRAPSVKKKVAVIGGGPAGMKAAITAAERGHKVTLYEKGYSLGGLLRHTDFTQWKWAYKDFKDYLIRQTYKAGVEVILNTEATPDMIKATGYDTVLVALGSEPVISKIPGADGKNVYNIVDVYGNIKSLGKDVVLIGGGVFGSETGAVLVKEGYKVTALTSEKHMIPIELIGPHNKANQLNVILHDPNFSYVLEAITTRISDGKVTYKDARGAEKTIQADSVVVYAGLKPRQYEAMKFSGSAGQVLLLGDCTGENGNLQKAIRSAFFVTSQV